MFDWKIESHLSPDLSVESIINESNFLKGRGSIRSAGDRWASRRPVMKGLCTAPSVMKMDVWTRTLKPITQAQTEKGTTHKTFGHPLKSSALSSNRVSAMRRRPIVPSIRGRPRLGESIRAIHLHRTAADMNLHPRRELRSISADYNWSTHPLLGAADCLKASRQPTAPRMLIHCIVSLRAGMAARSLIRTATRSHSH
jgi:hypothetical protein